MNILPQYPNDRATRKQAIRAALITEKCVDKILRHQALNNLQSAKAVENGVVGFLKSQNVMAEHLVWARIQLRCHADGGRA